jgi:hypothetical protein
MTKDELIAQCKLENPKMIANILGEEVELTAQEYEKACEDWANMRLEQIALEQAQVEAESKRQSLLDKLGITEDEAKLLLGGI